MKAFKAKFGNDSLTMMFKTSADNVEVLSENEGRFNCGRILQIVLLCFFIDLNMFLFFKWVVVLEKVFGIPFWFFCVT